jgi:hypothetical protein
VEIPSNLYSGHTPPDQGKKQHDGKNSPQKGEKGMNGDGEIVGRNRRNDETFEYFVGPADSCI